MLVLKRYDRYPEGIFYIPSLYGGMYDIYANKDSIYFIFFLVGCAAPPPTPPASHVRYLSHLYPGIGLLGRHMGIEHSLVWDIALHKGILYLLKYLSNPRGLAGAPAEASVSSKVRTYIFSTSVT